MQANSASMAQEVRNQLSDKLAGYVPSAAGVSLGGVFALVSNWGVSIQLSASEEKQQSRLDKLDNRLDKFDLRFDKLEALIKNAK